MTALTPPFDAIGTRLDGQPLLLLLDVDGTLAPIVPRPEEARVPLETRAVLGSLARLPDVTIALVSGRAADDTMRVAGIAGAWIVGNHGFEVRSPDGRTSANSEAIPFEARIVQAASELARAARGIDGVIVENKRWTLSLHYRLVDEAEVPRLLANAREIGAAMGLRVTQGKKIVELRPPIAVDKGTAVLELAQRFGVVGPQASVMFAGDDRTDEDAFRALRSRFPRAVTVRIVAHGDDESESSDAEFQVDTPADLLRLLQWIAARRTAPAQER